AWGARRSAVCQTAVAHRAFSVAYREFDIPAMLVPSGIKLTVMSSGCGQAETMTTLRLLEADERFPAASVVVALIKCVPAAKAPLVKFQIPLAFAVVVPRLVVPSKSLTVLPASAVPLKLG